jgi:TPR repeat protein
MKTIWAALLVAMVAAVPGATMAAGEDPLIVKGEKAFDSGDQPGARAAFSEACDAGSPDGCFRYAIFLKEGAGGPADAPLARTKLARACNDLPAYLPLACEVLGEYLQNGTGGAVDVPAARDAYGAACGGEHGLGCFNYGALLPC